MSDGDAIQTLQQQAQAQWIPYGPPAPECAPAPRSAEREVGSNDASDSGGGEGAVQLVATFGHYQAEYAAIRKGVGILHEPQRGLLRFTGADRQDFLNRMLTQNIAAMTGGASRRAFQLNEKGRIVADVIVHHGDADTWLEGDAIDLPALAKLYDARLFGEDVTIANISADSVAFALHGPEAATLVRSLADREPEASFESDQTHHVLRLAGQALTCARRDVCGVPGYRLWCRREGAAALYERLTAAVGGIVPEVEADAVGGGAKRAIRGRGIGWLAFNTARIEAATPLFHVDFGPDSLPHETRRRTLDDAVSFTKGCYLGQEIVARMQNLGHPKRVLVGLRMADERLPVAGSEVFAEAAQGTSGAARKVVGAVTSSTLSPLLGQAAIALATIRWGQHQPGTTVAVSAEGALVEAAVQECFIANR